MFRCGTHLPRSDFPLKINKHTEQQTKSLYKTESNSHGPLVCDVITNHVCRERKQCDASYNTQPLYNALTLAREGAG